MASLSGHQFKFKSIILASVSAIVLTACDPVAEEGDAAGRSNSAQGIEGREFEAPDAYSAQSKALWDGRPSFGGAWIAAEDVTTPEQVRVENTANGRVIKAALYKRERDLPGPLFQVSMDAANELGMQAGTPVELRVVAIRKETVEIPPVNAGEEIIEEAIVEDGVEVAAATATGAVVAAAATSEDAVSGEALPEITTTTEVSDAPVGDLGAEVPTLASVTRDAVMSQSETTMDAMFAAAAVAVDAAALAASDDAETVAAEANGDEVLTEDTVAAALAAVPVAATQAVPAAGEPLKSPFIQVATVGSQADADAAVAKLNAAGLKAGARKAGDSFGVIVGPLTSANEQTAALASVKKMGYADAFLTR